MTWSLKQKGVSRFTCDPAQISILKNCYNHDLVDVLGSFTLEAIPTKFIPHIPPPQFSKYEIHPIGDPKRIDPKSIITRGAGKCLSWRAGISYAQVVVGKLTRWNMQAVNVCGLDWVASISFSWLPKWGPDDRLQSKKMWKASRRSRDCWDSLEKYFWQFNSLLWKIPFLISLNHV